MLATLDAAALEKLVSAAMAAPPPPGAPRAAGVPGIPATLGPLVRPTRQPWRFRLDPEHATVQVRAVQAPLPGDRSLHLCVGAALFNLRVAMAHLGWEPVVRLLPAPASPDLLATVRLAGPVLPGTRNRPDLYASVWRRHSSVIPLSRDRRPPAAVTTALREAAQAEGAALSFAATGAPLIAVLATDHDDPAGWLRAGQALQHVLLTATAHALRVAPLETPDPWRLGAEAAARHPLVALRLGYGP
ncbi:hypothetical protein G5C51_00470 [Streptomyces sp. A7024]|uniref:Nitroreductase domain-containing protein n=1 Tax=Streptomyces coryli TaxID=1128680 RepID=A0A6G4TSD8_9ACTN|nr:hypothetical protein [Streptomyces coryli]NGN62386.1 hypothetical protein [Streptomyces coryli]